LLSTTAARAADDAPDTTPPVIQHLAITQIPGPGPVRIDFTVSDESPLFGVLFHWRHIDEPTYRQIEFPDVSARQFAAQFTVTKGFEFWIEAYDENGNGPALDGSAEKPNVVKIVKPTGAPPPAKAEPPKAEPPKPLPTTPAPSTPAKTEPTRPAVILEPTEAEKSKPPPPPEVKIAVSSAPEEPPPPPPAPPILRPIAPGRFAADRTGTIYSAQNLPAGRVQLGLDGGLFSGTNFLYPGTSLFGQQGTLHVMGAVHDLVNIGASTRFAHAKLSSSVTNAGTGYPLSASVMNDVTLLGRVSLPAFGPVRLGVLGGLGLPGRVRDTVGGMVLSPSVTLLTTVQKSNFRLHFNAGYKWDNSGEGALSKNKNNQTVGGRDSAFSTFALGLSKYDSINIGAAAELAIQKAVPYVGYDLSIPVDRAALASCTSADGASCAPATSAFPAANWQVPQRLTLGVRYEITQFLAVDGAAELSLTKAGRGLDTPFDSEAKTASYLPLDGQVLPPPFQFRLGVQWQFGDIPLPWNKRAPLEPEKPTAAPAPVLPANELKPEAPPARPATPDLNKLEFEAPVTTPPKLGPSSSNDNDSAPVLMAERVER
jgi:hypothetical protein